MEGSHSRARRPFSFLFLRCAPGLSSLRCSALHFIRMKEEVFFRRPRLLKHEEACFSWRPNPFFIYLISSRQGMTLYWFFSRTSRVLSSETRPSFVPRLVLFGFQKLFSAIVYSPLPPYEASALLLLPSLVPLRYQPGASFR